MAYSVQSAYGDVNCLGIRWGKVQRSDVTSTAVECQKRRCPYFPNKCFLHLARRRAAACDIVVTNHSLLFRQVGSDIEVLPPVALLDRGRGPLGGVRGAPPMGQAGQLA